MVVHVSIHDVSPVWGRELEAALDLCDAVGACPALLVVPNFHGSAPLLDDPPFCGRLRALQARGHEIYLHGFFHRSHEHRNGSDTASRLARLLAQRIASSSEAEMSDLSEEQGCRRLDHGEIVLKEAGLRIDGFVAPAWTMPRWLPPVLAARGYRYTEDHLRVYDPAGARSRLSVLLNWASRSPVRLLSTVAWCRAAKLGRAVLPARIAIHPADMRFLQLRREIARTLDWAHGDIAQCAAELFA